MDTRIYMNKNVVVTNVSGYKAQAVKNDFELWTASLTSSSWPLSATGKTLDDALSALTLKVQNRLSIIESAD